MGKKRKGIINSILRKALPKSKRFPPRFRDIFFRDIYIRSAYSDRERFAIIENGYQINPIVYGICTLLGEAATEVKWKVVHKETGQECKVPMLNVGGYDGERYIPAILEEPNVEFSWEDFIHECFNQLLLSGNLYIAGERGTGILRDQIGYMYALPSFGVEIYRDYYKVNQGQFRNLSPRIPRNMVCAIKYPNPDYTNQESFLYGQSPFKAVEISVRTHNQSLLLGEHVLATKGASKIIFPDTEQEIDEEQAQTLRDKLSQTTEGIPNIGKLALSSLKLGVLDLTVSSKDVLMMEQRAKAESEICNVLKVPLQLIGHSGSRSGVYTEKEAQAMMWRNAVIPVLKKICRGLNRWLLPTYGSEYMLKYDVSHIDALAHDKLALGKSIKQIERFITYNEARDLVGLPRISKERGGDNFLVDADMDLMVNNVPMEEGDAEELAYQDDYNLRSR